MAKTNSYNVEIRQNAITDRWGELIIKKGFTPMSNFFLEHYHELNPLLNHQQVVMIMQLMSFKWTKAAPFPSVALLKKRMSLSESALRAILRSLEKSGYVKRELRTRRSSFYHMDNLIIKLEELYNIKYLSGDNFCSRCNEKIEVDSNFCSKCGLKKSDNIKNDKYNNSTAGKNGDDTSFVFE